MSDPTERNSKESFWIVVIVATAFFMENLDSTIIATALPQMARSFGVGASSLSIGMSAYMVTLALFIPVSGWIADRCGARAVFGVAIAIFTLGSALCGLTSNATMFTIARVLQGIGGAAMVPVGRLLVLRSTPKRDLIQALATVTLPGLTATVIGPPLGGFITTFASWRWIFLLNLPLGLLGILLVATVVPYFAAQDSRRFDWLGFFLSGASLGSLLAGAELLGREPGSAAIGLALFGISVVFGYLLFRHARAHRSPLIDYSVLRFPTFSVTVISGSMTRVAIGAVPFLVPLLLQASFGMSAFKAGVLFLAFAAGTVGIRAVTTRIVKRFGFRSTMTANAIAVSLTLGCCAILSSGSSPILIFFVLFLGGMARSMQFACLNSLAFADIEPGQMSSASTLYSTIQQAAMGMGIAMGALALQWAGRLNAGLSRYAVSNFRMAFLFIAVIAFVSAFGYANLPQGAGDKLRV